MAEFAALPLFTDSWIADTAHLTRHERGLYFDLLVLMWRTPGCRVPNEIDWIMRRLSCKETERVPIASISDEFFGSPSENNRGWVSPFDGSAERHADWQVHPARLLGARWRKIRTAVLSNHRGGCCLCGGETKPFEVDHIFPRRHGGSHEWSNLQVLCRTCNRRKGCSL